MRFCLGSSGLFVVVVVRFIKCFGHGRYYSVGGPERM